MTDSPLNSRESEEVLGTLNQILELELAGLVRYLHYSFMIFGHNRIPIVAWLRDLQAAQAESRRYDFVSLAQIQQWTGMEPLDSVLVFENYPLDRTTESPRVVGIDAIDNTTFPLTLSAHLDSSLHLDSRRGAWRAKSPRDTPSNPGLQRSPGPT